MVAALQLFGETVEHIKITTGSTGTELVPVSTSQQFSLTWAYHAVRELVSGFSLQ